MNLNLSSKLRRAKRMVRHRLQQAEAFLKRYPKATVGTMFIILCMGLLFVLIRRSAIDESRSDVLDTFTDSLLDTASYEFEPVAPLSEYRELLQVEDQLNDIMLKDTLTRQDSAFLREINARLNKLIQRNVKD